VANKKILKNHNNPKKSVFHYKIQKKIPAFVANKKIPENQSNPFKSVFQLHYTEKKKTVFSTPPKAK